jgi:hypothetical protein
LFNPFWKGMPYPFKDDELQAYLAAQKIPMSVQKQYFDTFVVSRSGVTTQGNREVKRKLGFADEQPFTKSMLDALTHVASTSMGDDCGEGFRQPGDWSKLLASRGR